MSKRTTFWLAWSMLSLFLVITFFDLLFQIGNTPSEWLSDILTNLVLLAFITVGLLIASRRPENPIGWLFCTSTLLWALGSVLQEYTTSAYDYYGSRLPTGAVLIGIVGHWLNGIGFFLMLTYLLLLFPTGHLPSPRWRFLAWLIAILLVFYSIAFLLSPHPYANSAIDSQLANMRNPIGIGPANDVFDQLGGDLPLLLFPIIIVCIISVILRFRRARGIERQQLKWFTYGLAISVFMLIIILFLVFTNVSGASWPFYLAVACIPISAGIAILRYRLFDIDVLIRRTLIYTTLTVILALLYFSLVFVLSSLLRSFLGQQENPLIIVASTLVVAALFQPLRRRIQAIIDRRFYRRKYDAAQTLAALSATLRNELDLPTLSKQLVAIVEETMQPAHVSLWLRPPPSYRADQAPWRTAPAGPFEDA